VIRHLSLHALPVSVLLFAAARADADEIHDLIEQGALDKVKLLIAKNPDLKRARDKMELTPLHTAASANKLEIVKFLLEQGVEVNAVAYNRFTPLHLTEDPRIIKLLVAHKANLEAVSAGGTPLQHAAHRLLGDDTSDYAKKGWAMAEVLIEVGAKYDILSAARLGDLDRVKGIVKADRTEALNKGAMRDAARCGHLAIVQHLLDNKGDPDDADFGGLPVLYFSLRHPDIVRALIKARADVKSPFEDKRPFGTGVFPEGCTILHEAANAGVTESARLLVEAGAEVDARDPHGLTPLQYAAGSGWPEIVKLLREHKASINGDDGAKALRAAVSRIYYAEQTTKEVDRYKTVITFLTNEGVPTDLRTAIVLGDTEQVKKLVKQNRVGPGPVTPHEKPVLHLAVGLDRKDVVTALLDGGAPVEGVDDSGYTALHDAASWGRAEIAKLLIERGARVEARTNSGATPLREAARCGSLAAARVLLAAGADVNAKDKRGKTPLGSVDRSDTPMIEFLKMNGGK
jgi:ankyrin repeat protein